ncbi:MAG TPA: hypothetical protein VGO47_12625 [Chlamydiales bacterium]|nr:hypothetical protein [Chlamydiales bacterium]
MTVSLYIARSTELGGLPAPFPKFPVMSLSNDQNVAQVFIVALFLGIFLVTFGIALRWLLWEDEGWKLRHKIGWIMVLFTGIIFGLTLTRAVWLLRDIMVSVMEPFQVNNATEDTSKPVETRPTVNLAGIADVSVALLSWQAKILRMPSHTVYTCKLAYFAFGRRIREYYVPRFFNRNPRKTK